MVTKEVLERAVGELEQAGEQYRKLAELAGHRPERSSPSQLRSSVVHLFRHFLHDGRPEELQKLFEIRFQCDYAMALALRNFCRDREYESKVARQQLNEIVSHMDRLSRCETVDIEMFLTLDFEFHAAIADNAQQKQMGRLIRDLGKHQLATVLSDLFTPCLMSPTINEHRDIIDAIFHPEEDDSLLERCISRHVIHGQLQTKALQKAANNASNSRSLPSEAVDANKNPQSKDASMGLLTDDLMAEYKERVFDRLKTDEHASEVWDDIVSELVSLQNELGSRIAVRHFDLTVERKLLQHLHGDDKFLLYEWATHTDNQGRERLTARLHAVRDTYSEAIKYKLTFPPKVAKQIVMDRPVHTGYSLSHH